MSLLEELTGEVPPVKIETGVKVESSLAAPSLLPPAGLDDLGDDHDNDDDDEDADVRVPTLHAQP
jgi:hypothetical protein